MSIQRREVYFDFEDGLMKFWDWARVTTTVGMMIEPFVLNSHRSLTAETGDEFDAEDEIVRVDSIRAVSFDVEQAFLSDGDHVHGGRLLPRSGR